MCLLYHQLKQVLLRFYNYKVIVSGIIPRDFSPDIWRKKIRLLNIQIKYAVGEMNNNNPTYINPDNTWTTSGGALNTNLYYKKKMKN